MSIIGTISIEDIRYCKYCDIYHPRKEWSIDKRGWLYCKVGKANMHKKQALYKKYPELRPFKKKRPKSTKENIWCTYCEKYHHISEWSYGSNGTRHCKIGRGEYFKGVHERRKQDPELEKKFREGWNENGKIQGAKKYYKNKCK